MKNKRTRIDLFAAGKDHTNACLNFTPFVDYGYIEGYRLGAEILVDHVDATNTDHDLLVFPIVFLLRHHFELQLKNVIRNGRRLFDIESDEPLVHALRKFWPIARELMARVDDCNPENRQEFLVIENLIAQFAVVDDHSTSFRYPRDRDGNPSLPGLKHINLVQLRGEAILVSKILDSFSSWILQNIERRGELNAAGDPGW